MQLIPRWHDLGSFRVSAILLLKFWCKHILWDSNSHLPKAKETSTPSTSQGCGKYFNLDLNAYSTNLANMEAMRKEIARLNEVIGKRVDKCDTIQWQESWWIKRATIQARKASLNQAWAWTHKRSQDKWKKVSEWLWVCVVWEEGQNWYRLAYIDHGSAASPSSSATQW